MRALKLALPAAILMTGFMLCTTATYGKPEYAKKEKKSCTFCHAKQEAKEQMPKNLNDAGKYYQAHDHSLDGYKPPEKK
jgi:cytochrome c553